MNGPEHYSEAENMIGKAKAAEAGSDMERYYLGAAQVHATLALAAATALTHIEDVHPRELRPWFKAAGVMTAEQYDQL